MKESSGVGNDPADEKRKTEDVPFREKKAAGRAKGGEELWDTYNGDYAREVSLKEQLPYGSAGCCFGAAGFMA